MQRNNNMLNKAYQHSFIDIDKFIIINNMFLKNKTKNFFITLIFKKDVDRAVLMTYNEVILKLN